jgi:starch phosphorylase
MNLNEITTKKFQKSIGECTTEQLYLSICEAVNNQMTNKPTQRKKKKLYYICAEFLIGKLLVNNLINTGFYDQVKTELENHGKSNAYWC